ncbi:MAG: hypothetical protein OXR03_09995 [Rhodospirillaceae bacterium]|nr:hypothetical protein [Rhodospirillaceae bacterium]
MKKIASFVFLILAGLSLSGCVLTGTAAAVAGVAGPVVIEAYSALKSEVICPSLSESGKKKADNIAEHVRKDSSYQYCPD